MNGCRWVEARVGKNLFDVDLSALTQTAYQAITLATTGVRAYQVNALLFSVQINDNQGAAQFIKQAVFRPQIAGLPSWI